ncbi:MAG TPA: molybdopterin dinucleotide binding domain-containing protein, partial [Paracoccaceae bacterium]|nr:molybdopterin dinucleotide binding domain-containing protein [Paracoccaceae bacterium]
PERQLHGQLYQARRHNAPVPIRLNAGDAKRTGLHGGEVVSVFNDRGACLARVEVDPGVRARVAIMPTGAWFAPDPDDPGLERNGNPNVLTDDRRTSRLGQGSAAQSTLVRIARRDPSAPAGFSE